MRSWMGAALALLILAATGCAASKAFHTAEHEARRENWDQAVLNYSKATALDPGNSRYDIALARAKLKASAQHFEKAKRYAKSAQWDLAVAEYQQTLLLYPGNQHAADELDKALAMIRRRDEQPSEIQRMKEQAKKDALAPPKLSAKSNIPIQVQFRDRPIGQIFDVIGKASGINFIYDEKTDLNKPMTIEIGSVTIEKALDILMLQTKNFYKVIDEHTLLIAPDNRQTRQVLEDQVIRTFYLSSAETKQVVAVIRTLLNSRQVAENDALNSVSIKDTPDKVAIAEKLIESNDKSKGEVIIDVQLMEINRKTLQTLGIDLSSKSLSLTFQDGKSSVPLNNLSTLKQKGNWLIGPIPSVVLNFLKSDTDTKAIAQPQLRVSEGEKAEIVIANRVPIPNTSFNSSQTVGGNIVPITSFTYQNVGITLQIEPRVHHNKEVTLKVQVEVSNLAGTVDLGTGVTQPIIGTRQVQTVIRLRDGESNLLAGLIKRDDTTSKSGVIGITDIPGIGDVFSTRNIDRQETDIVLTLTPYIVRIPDIQEDDLQTLWVGTEDNMRLRGSVRGVMGVSPFQEPEDNGKSLEIAPNPAKPYLPPVASPEAQKSGTGPVIEHGREGAPVPAPAPGGGGGGGGGTTVPVPVPTPEGSPQEAPPTEETPSETAGGETVDENAAPETPPAVGPATVRLVPSAPSFRVGDRVIVEARIENATNVGSVPFHLRYNRQVLEFVPPAVQGPFLNGDGANTVFLANDANGGGEIVVGLSRLGGGEGISGAGTLATFQFQAINPGDCGFAWAGASVKDPQARNVPASFLTAPVSVAP
ncbi:MAG TPA: secretin N-terminal domain-containing protein [Candidatus Polarisedimenticolaceae bacterium]|nr:secretin N-terminal domain-containing protein [Candidatus Polarisedimenticolaceae bacterium]